MKKIIISLAALAVLSTASLAQRNYDISSPPVGETQLEKLNKNVNSGVDSNTDLFAVPGTKRVVPGNYDNNVRDNIGRGDSLR
jgi:hypothetical protein